MFSIILKHPIEKLFTIVGLVTIWPSIWYTLDHLDMLLSGGSHFWTSIGVVVFKLCIL